MKLCKYLLVSQAFNLQRTPLEKKLEITFSIKNSVSEKEEYNLRPVLHDCSCIITSKGNKEDTISPSNSAMQLGYVRNPAHSPIMKTR